jgi:hypothetical protein
MWRSTTCRLHHHLTLQENLPNVYQLLLLYYHYRKGIQNAWPLPRVRWKRKRATVFGATVFGVRTQIDKPRGYKGTSHLYREKKIKFNTSLIHRYSREKKKPKKNFPTCSRSQLWYGEHHCNEDWVNYTEKYRVTLLCRYATFPWYRTPYCGMPRRANGKKTGSLSLSFCSKLWCEAWDGCLTDKHRQI